MESAGSRCLTKNRIQKLHTRSVLNIMGPMSLDITVLRALLRLARRRAPATTAELLARVDTDEAEIERIVARLVRSELAYRVEGGVRLSLGGLAVAAATVAPVGKASKASAPTAAPTAPRVAARAAAAVPMARRRRAA